MLAASSDSLDHIAPSGATTGPPVVFLHGIGSTATEDWPPTRWAQPLTEAGREFLGVRLPGHDGGPAVSSVEDATTSRVLQWIAGMVGSVTTETVDVVGYSLGARLAWDLAGNGALPVQQLVLGGLSPAEPFAQLDFTALRDAAHGRADAADPLTGAIAGMISGTGQDTESLLYLIEGLAREPFDPSTCPPVVPTLLLGGADDPMVQGIDGLTGYLPAAQLMRVPGDHQQALASDAFRTASWDFLRIRA